MSTRRRRHNGWWTEQVGGMPLWGLAASAAFVVGILVWALLSMPDRVTADPNRELRPVPTFTQPSQPEQGTAFTMPEAGAPVYLIGDSWSTGYSADPGQGYVDLLRAQTGWNITANAQTGTGYISVLADAGEPYPERVDDLPAETPSLVIIQGGLNDEWGGGSEQVGDVARPMIEATLARYPGAQVVLVGPATAAWPVTETLVSIDKQLQGAAVAAGAWYVSPLSGEWVTEENFSTFIDPETIHPSNKGHAEYARRLIESLSAL